MKVAKGFSFAFITLALAGFLFMPGFSTAQTDFATITVTVKADIQGSPAVKGVSITFVGVGYNFKKSAMTDADGKGTMGKVPREDSPYSMRLELSKKGFKSKTETIQIQKGTASYTVDVKMAPTEYVITGYVKDQDLALVAGASVVTSSESAVTDANGFFTITRSYPPAPGAVQIKPVKAGYYSEFTSVNVDSSKLEFSVVPYLQMVLDLGSVTGIVLSKSGTKIAGATISCEGKTATSGSDGSFKVDSIPSGDREILVAKSGYNDLKAPVTVRAGTIVKAGNLAIEEKAAAGPSMGKKKVPAIPVQPRKKLGR